MLHSKTRNI